MAGQIKQRIEFCNRDVLGSVADLSDFITRANFPFLENPEVKARPMMGDKQSSHLGLIRPDAHPITGHPRLGHFEECRANPIAIANAHFVIRQAFDREVLTELGMAEIASAEMTLPIPVGVQLVHHHGAMLAAMTGKVSLSVTVDIQAPYGKPSSNRHLPDRRIHRLPAPFNVTWKTNVH